MITPPYLEPGDKVAIVAPARRITPGELEIAIATLQHWGLKVLTGQHLFGAHNQFSGTDEERLIDLQTLLDDTGIKALFCARGGYGTTRILDHLSFSRFIEHPKWIVGFSDITALHNLINQKTGIETLHAAMPFTFPSATEESLESLRKILFGQSVSYSIPPNGGNRMGLAQGILTGGNLSMIYSSQATSSEIDCEGKILFLEDLDEYLYHIDRMIMNLKRSGKLENLAGLILGGMSDMKDNTIAFGKTAEEIISEAVNEYTYPVCFGFPAGHSNSNHALIMGREVTLSVADAGVSLDFSTPKVSGQPGFPMRKFIKSLLFTAGFFALIYLVYSIIVLIGGK